MRDAFRRCPVCGFAMTSRIIPSYGLGWIEEWFCPRGHSSSAQERTETSDSTVPLGFETVSSGTVGKGDERK